jgi:hypothetical protein
VSSKKHYLVVWPTIRKDWIGFFETLKDDFEFTFLPSTFSKEPNYAVNFSCCYWSEFDSVRDLLKRVQPDGIIFMSIESGLSMVLNFVAQKKGIPTYILQHGIYTNYRDYRIREKLWRKKEVAQSIKEEQSGKAFSTFKFIYKSLKGTEGVKLLWIAIYTKLQQKRGPYWAAKHLPLRLKRANRYLCFSPYNAIIHKETDRITNDQIQYIGSPELIPYLEEEVHSDEGDYYLHIDQALAENSFGEETVSKERMTDFYLKLNKFCLSKMAKLYVKLHPESYNSDWLPKHENITYLKQVENLNAVIQSAQGCFGFYSTMIIPAVYWKPTILFKIQYSGLQEAIAQLNGASILDFWNFGINELEFSDNKVERHIIKKQFILPEGVDQYALRDTLNG